MNYFELFRIALSRKPASPDFEKMTTKEIIEYCDSHVSKMQDIIIFDRMNIEIPEIYPIQKILVPRYGKKQYEISFNFVKAAFKYDQYSVWTRYLEAEKIDSQKAK